MNRFLKAWRLTGRGEAFRAHIVAYADDFVILSRARAGEALAWTKAAMVKLGLTLNEAKTSLRDARQGALRLSWLYVRPAPSLQGRAAVLRRKSVEEKRATHQDEGRRHADARRQGPVAASAQQAEQASARLVGVFWLRQPRQGVSGRRSLRRRSCARLPRGKEQDAKPRRVALLQSLHPWRPWRRVALAKASQSCAESLAMKLVGKPDAGNPHVRFDERGRETERCRMAQATAPFLESIPGGLLAGLASSASKT